MLMQRSSAWSTILPIRGSTCSRLRHTAARAQTRQVVLTREQGKNEELMQALDARSISWLEMPLIEAAEGPDRSAEGLPLLQQLYTRLHTLGHRELLSVLLVEDQFDYVVLTSPEAAAVFISGWRDAGKPPVRIATVGTGTSRVLLADADAAALTPVFEPTKANAVHLSAELPEVVGGSKRVLYPASVKAGTDLQNGLATRGFACTRIHTYNTLPVQHVDAGTMQQACEAAVVTFASPSAVKAWVSLTAAARGGVPQLAVACIGSTSARAAESAGLAPIFYPEAPGMAGFLDSIEEALEGSAAAV